MDNVQGKVNICETERLLIPPFINEDFEAIYKLRSDVEFMRHLRRNELREESDSWIEYVSSFWKFDIVF